MKRFVQELRIIPGVAWLIALIAYVALAGFLAHFAGHDSGMRAWPLWGKSLFCGLIPLPLLPYVALIGYVNRDARRRGMRYVMWTLLAIFIPNALGIILYFVLREPLLTPCPQCATPVKRGFAFCPTCGARVGRVCPQCQKAAEPEWSHCPACGTKLVL
jgi:hypothetical protein